MSASVLVLLIESSNLILRVSYCAFGHSCLEKKACVNLPSFSVGDIVSRELVVLREEIKHQEQSRVQDIMNHNDIAKHFNVSQILVI